MHPLFAAAERLGVSVSSATLPEGTLGAYYAASRRILIDRRLTPEEEVETLAHEIGHVVLGHRALDDPVLEADADAFAAMVLIDPIAYERLERMELCAHDIAEELGVTMPILAAFVAQLRRDSAVARAAARIRAST
ncbi:MAG: ImmA/IrrE family metallo-endopeptidase [Microbacterium sp.]|uniref:ImmA/IrrE family metallo-endopeptidase n=1 Tax=Microbacterium sp. TaxID=51671 RepID=UPI001AC6F888|nr:ImmA/IrrE family metallo-endopeptidase [Microbacterium sp.]MBN9177660.1 ImmA/IrrE family metallo-endopeptidase [Microbacterium sp.]